MYTSKAAFAAFSIFKICLLKAAVSAVIVPLLSLNKEKSA